MLMMCRIFNNITIEYDSIQDFQYIFNYEGKTKKIGNIKCEISNNFSDNGCIFPSCKAMHLEIYNKKSPYNEKVIIYFELIFIENNDIITYVNDNLIDIGYDNLNYLNLEGLYLFSELITSKRYDKPYDIDLYRKKILKKILGKNESRIFKHILSIYTYIFNSRKNFKTIFQDLIKNYVLLFNNNIIDNYCSYLTEEFRPFINSFIKKIDNELKYTNKVNFSSNYNHLATIFITGGDAFRRYIPDTVTSTNDIDAKIIYKNKKCYNKILDITISNMSDLIDVLYNTKPVFNESIFTVNNDITISFIPKYDGGQYRLRYIENEDFTLISIDYRFKLNIKIKSLNIDLKINQEFSLLDIVLYNDKNFNKTDSNYIDGIPIASANYLKNDLRKIYETVSRNLRDRFPKKQKDKNRFIKLMLFFKNEWIKCLYLYVKKKL